MTGDDRDLYESFARVRREEEVNVPEISMLSLNAHKRGRSKLSGKLVTAAMCLVALIAAFAWLRPRSRLAFEGSNFGREPAGPSITSWKPDTDFLLDTPGRGLLEGIPVIGEWHGVAIGPGPGESHRPLRKHVLR